MAGRTNPADFIPALEAGAALGAPLANVLCYDRDPIRRTEKLVELAELAAPFDIALAIEFYPPSQVQTLSAALEEIARSGRSDIKVTADLLHIMRGPEPDTSFPLLNHPAIAIAQIADGPTTIDPSELEREAGIQRQLPGQGTPLSVEIPQQDAIDKGINPQMRAKWAVDCVKEVVKRTH
jgi:sugar phosphate isomerase/epimerase